MAEVKAFEENLTCSVCLNIYRDPHELSCRHTFCLECVNRIERFKDWGNEVTCPQCREVTGSMHVKKDFKMQTFVDILNSKNALLEQEMKSAMPGKCDVCNETGKAIVSKCTECRQKMCANCDQSHSRFQMSKNHTTVSVKILKSIVRDTVTDLEKQIGDVREETHKLNKSLKKISNNKNEQVTYIDTYIKQLQDEFIKYTELKKKVDKANDKILVDCSTSQKVLSGSKRDLESHVSLLNQLISTGSNVDTFLDTCEDVNNDAVSSSQRIKKRLPQIKSIKSPVTVEKGMKWNPNQGPTVTFTEDAYLRATPVSATPTTRQWQESQLSPPNTYKLKKRVRYDSTSSSSSGYSNPFIVRDGTDDF